MDKFNHSHVKDVTPFEAEKNIMRKVHKRAAQLVKMMSADVKLTGFKLDKTPVTLRDPKTGVTVTMTIGGDY